MLVKNISLGLLLGFVASTSVMAATHTVSLGYGQSKINESEGLKDLKVSTFSTNMKPNLHGA